MYFKAPDSGSRINLPIGYRGSAFPHAVQQGSSSAAMHKKTSEEYKNHSSAPSLPTGSLKLPEKFDEEKESVEKDKGPSKSGSVLQKILSPEGSLETEDLLLLALALIIFQSGKENELALLLIALLFIK